MSSKPSTQQTQQQSQTSPWGAAAGYFPTLYSQGAGAVGQNQALPVPQQFVAGATPAEQSAVQQTLNVAPSLGASGTSLSDMASKVASGYFTNPMNDPNFQGAATAAITPVTRQLTQSVLPQIIQGTGGGGGGPTAYGGATQSFDLEKALQDYQTNVLNTTGTMAQNAYTAGLNLIPQAGGIAQAGNTQLLAPAIATGAAGSAQQQYAQDAINNLLQQYQYTLQAPWQGLQPFANLLTTGGFGTSTGTSTTTGTPPSMATQILQGLTGGAGMVGSLFGSGPGGSPSAISNLGSTLGSLFSGASGALSGAGGTLASMLPMLAL